MAKLWTAVVLLMVALSACTQASQVEGVEESPTTDENGFFATANMRLATDCSREDGVYLELWVATAEEYLGRAMVVLIYEGEIIASVAESPALLSVVTKDKTSVFVRSPLGQGRLPSFIFDEVLASKGLPPWTGEGCF